jgi:hypothetical protein
MKKTLISLIFLVVSNYSYSQTHSIGLSPGYIFSGGAADFAALDGASSYHYKSGNQFGLNYRLQLSKNLSLLSGLQRQQLSMEAQNGSSTGELQTWDFQVENLNIPFYANLSFFKYFFVEGGPMLNFQVNQQDPFGIDDQSGIGAALAIGAQYDIGKLNVFIKSQTLMQAIIPFSKENYHDRLTANSLTIGVFYQL